MTYTVHSTHVSYVLSCPARHTWDLVAMLDPTDGTLIVAEFDPNDPELEQKMRAFEETLAHCPTCGEAPIASELKGMTTQYIAEKPLQ